MTIEHLLLRWRSGSLTKAEVEELKSSLRDRETRSRLVEEALLDEAMKAAFRSQRSLRIAHRKITAIAPGPEEDSVDGTIYCVSAESRLAQWRQWASLAAVLAILAGGIMWWHQRPPVLQGQLQTSDDGITLQRDGQIIIVARDLLARAGDVIRTASESTATFRFDDEQTSITVSGDSELRLASSTAGKRIELTKGNVVADVAKQPSGRPLVFRTPHADVTVIGTRFLVTAESNATRIVVREGRVRVTDRVTGAMAELGAGGLAVANGSSAVKTVVPKVSVSASSDDGNAPENTLDGDLDTRWSARGDGQWVKFDLGEVKRISAVRMAFFRGDRRQNFFHIETSVDDKQWTSVLAKGESSGTSNGLQTFAVTASNARYVRITGHGGTGIASLWNSYTEVQIE